MTIFLFLVLFECSVNPTFSIFSFIFNVFFVIIFVILYILILA